MRLLKRLLKNKRGQSTIEFALMLVFIMAFILFFFQFSMVSAVGSYIHYATFLAARAYQSAGPSQADQIQRAQEVLNKMLKKSEFASGLDRWPLLASGVGDGDPQGVLIGPGTQYDSSTKDFSWMDGVRYKFRSKIFLLPIGGDSSTNNVELTAESWLTRDPSYLDCTTELGRFERAIFDNGC